MATQRRRKRDETGDKQPPPSFDDERGDSRESGGEREGQKGGELPDENPNWWRNEGGGPGEVH
jgi:hypothetical protein